MRAAFLVLLCFASLYGIKLSFFPLSLAVALWPLYALFLLFRGSFHVRVDPRLAMPFVCVSGLLLYSVYVSAVIGGGKDYTVVYNFLVWLMFFIPAALVLSTETPRADGKGCLDVYALLLAATTIQAVCIYLSFLSEGFRGLVSAVLVAGEQVMGDASTRVKGFSSVAGASLSLIQGIGAAVGLKLFVEGRGGKYLACSALVAGSALFPGRTGVLFIALFVAAYLPYCVCSGRLRLMTLVPVAVALVALALFGYDRFVGDEYKALFEDQVVGRGFDVFETLFASGDLREHGAVAAIIDMYKLPDNMSTWLVGDGFFFLNGANYTGDPGYIKYLYYFGLLGCFLMYGYFLLLMVMTIRNSASTAEKVFVFIFYMLFFFFECKEPFFAKANIICHMLYFYAVQTAAARVPEPLADGVGDELHA